MSDRSNRFTPGEAVLLLDVNIVIDGDDYISPERDPHWDDSGIYLNFSGEEGLILDCLIPGLTGSYYLVGLGCGSVIWMLRNTFRQISPLEQLARSAK